MPSYRYIVFLSMLLTVMACSPGGYDSTDIKMDDIIGLWNSSENDDVMYTRIAANGDILEYDYDGDDVDQGLSCYQIESGSIKHIEANRFLVMTDMHDNKQFEIELELLDAGHALKVYFLSGDDTAGENNSTKVSRSQIWTRESDISKLDQEPSCR